MELTATIIPIPQKTGSEGLNSYRPVALTPVVMKCLERLVLQHIKVSLSASLDPHQYAYRQNRSTDDISTALHVVLGHLEHSLRQENPQSYQDCTKNHRPPPL